MKIDHCPSVIPRLIQALDPKMRKKGGVKSAASMTTTIEIKSL